MPPYVVHLLMAILADVRHRHANRCERRERSFVNVVIGLSKEVDIASIIIEDTSLVVGGG